MTKPLITLPCTARDLENALHAVCDHHGLWDANIGWNYDAPPRSASLVLYRPPCASAATSQTNQGETK